MLNWELSSVRIRIEGGQVNAFPNMGSKLGELILAYNNWVLEKSNRPALERKSAFGTKSIPDNLGNLNNLKVLGLGSNRLSGSIPDSIARLTNLRQLFVDDNLLMGTVPASIVSLSEIIMNSNKLGKHP